MTTRFLGISPKEFLYVSADVRVCVLKILKRYHIFHKNDCGSKIENIEANEMKEATNVLCI